MRSPPDSVDKGGAFSCYPSLRPFILSYIGTDIVATVSHAQLDTILIKLTGNIH